MAGHPTRPEAALIARRRTDALQLRMAGVDYLTIGRKLAADPAINSARTAYPCGYGIERYQAGEPPPSDSKLAEIAKADCFRAMNHRRTRLGEAVGELRDMQDERLNRMLAAQWQAAASGDSKAAELVLRIMERQARLHGLDAPTRTEISGEGGTPIRLEAVLETDRAAAIEAVKSFRLDKEESAAALALLGASTGDADPDVEAGFGAGLSDEDEDELTQGEQPAQAPGGGDPA